MEISTIFVNFNIEPNTDNSNPDLALGIAVPFLLIERTPVRAKRGARRNRSLADRRRRGFERERTTGKFPRHAARDPITRSKGR